MPGYTSLRRLYISSFVSGVTVREWGGFALCLGTPQLSGCSGSSAGPLWSSGHLPEQKFNLGIKLNYPLRLQSSWIPFANWSLPPTQLNTPVIKCSAPVRLGSASSKWCLSRALKKNKNWVWVAETNTISGTWGLFVSYRSVRQYDHPTGSAVSRVRAISLHPHLCLCT